jgi:hypothetical protein
MRIDRRPGVSPTVASTPTPTATPIPTPSPTPAPAVPLVVTAPCSGCVGTGGTGVQLTLVGEDGSVAATVDDPGGAYGNSYYVGSSDVYFIDGTTVKALARNGTVTDVGQVPQVKTTVTASDLQDLTSLAVSPDETTLVFGLPLARYGDNGATADHSQLWTEPTGGTAASATMVFDDADNTVNGGEVLMPFAWSNTGISVSEMPEGLGGVGPFLTYYGFNAATFDPITRTLHPLDCSVSTAPSSVCVTEEGDSTFKVVRSSGSETLTWQPANAEYGERVRRRTLPGVRRVRRRVLRLFRLLRDHGRGSEHRCHDFHIAGFRTGGVARRRPSHRVGMSQWERDLVALARVHETPQDRTGTARWCPGVAAG